MRHCPISSVAGRDKTLSEKEGGSVEGRKHGIGWTGRWVGVNQLDRIPRFSGTGHAPGLQQELYHPLFPSSFGSYVAVPIIIPTLPMKKLRHREVKEHIQGHKAGQWPRWDFDPVSSDSEAELQCGLERLPLALDSLLCCPSRAAWAFTSGSGKATGEE